MTINDTAMPRARRPETLSSRPAAPGESGTRRSNNLNPTAPGFAPRTPPELLLPELLPLRRKLLDARRLSPRSPEQDSDADRPRNLTGASTPRPAASRPRTTPRPSRPTPGDSLLPPRRARLRAIP